ncbi:hypothetical protein BDA99DRAFT_502356 [Phascolomyces articulosus]|uniref:Zinc finger CCCH domain-containing protein 14 n=1 Tax=Phascolomyces articulosus TaxID=60185 RepID=A0AAD5PGD3_9FUNG|nr:hypothetical protein BDA99DRAFT_502356 [Phascolomyces articulosus]
MQPQHWSVLENEIQAKCITYEYADSGDTTLAQFIINLLKVGNTADNVNQELQQLVGSDYNTDLTDWIFTRANELENPTATQSQKQESPKESPSNDAKETTQALPNSRGNRIFAQAIGSINGTTQRTRRSRSRSPEVRPRSRDRERSPFRNDRDDRGHDRNGRPHRSSNGRQVQILDSNGAQQESRPSVFDRLGGTARSVKSSQQAERCKYWPSCSQGEKCSYFHPKTICPDFPNCSKLASECMFIHPETSSSAQQQQQQLPQQPIMMQPIPTMPMKRPIPCKFFPYCTNPMCPFIHPEQPVAVSSPTATAGTVPSAAAVPVKRVPIPCKMGDQCKRPGCYFTHPGDADTNPVSEILCKYDGACTRPGCYYKHTVPPQPFTGGHRSLVLNKNDSISERQFSVADESVVERIVLGESADLITKNEPSKEEPGLDAQGEGEAMEM